MVRGSGSGWWAGLLLPGEEFGEGGGFGGGEADAGAAGVRVVDFEDGEAAASVAGGDDAEGASALGLEGVLRADAREGVEVMGTWLDMAAAPVRDGRRRVWLRAWGWARVRPWVRA